MATKVIMPALGMAQETGKLIAWLKKEGESVTKGEPIMEIETDKAVVEYDAAASGILGGVTAVAGQEIPVGEVVAWILEPGEPVPEELVRPAKESSTAAEKSGVQHPEKAHVESSKPGTEISPVARNVAREHNIDLNQIKTEGSRIRKADVLAFIEGHADQAGFPGLLPASPKARRLAAKHGLDLETISGSGPDGAVLTADVLAEAVRLEQVVRQSAISGQPFAMSKAWAVMADRLAEAWRTIPHFYLEREINASQMVVWRESAQRSTEDKITYTDLLTKAVAAALKHHPRVNASWIEGEILINDGVHVGLAVATADGLVVPVIPNTDELSVKEIASRRAGLVARAQEGRLKLQDIQGGTFTISNLGMYGVDGFIAIVNPPQAAILAVGKIVDKVMSVDGQVAVVPTLKLTLSCDHRVVDGAIGARFLAQIAEYLEDPLRIL